MRRLLLISLTLLTLPSLVFAQASPPSNKEPILLQLLDDISRTRHNAEIELASCEVQLKEFQQQLQVATKKDDLKESK